ncbi:UxaA family hydrolase [Cupriavidus metallidurans]|uniref:UxaA family hydrolase n=1 Tax=Cupriavidus metallidurans TaxID=119219 RepID=UPI001CCD4A3C|nr:UxaA family hydrolase [Cupriavidus metallidurans]UBM09360.1 UxaA family hydrolase [Cupriavidus metallidurans]
MTNAANTSALQFQGYVRADGRVGTRNYLGVLIVGNCAATAARKVADHFTAERLAAYPNVDGVVPFIHELGCGMEKSGEPMDLLRRTLGGSIRNPNLAGAVVLALGCDRNNIYAFMEQEELVEGPLLHTVVLQEVGGTANAIEAGVNAIATMLPAANQVVRQAVSAAHLTVGLQGEVLDADTSAVQAAIGAAADRLIAAGGTVIVSDTVATGARLAQRARTDTLKQDVEQTIVWWRDYTAGRDTVTPAQAAPGVPAWYGTGVLDAAVRYAEPLAADQHGLVLMDSPSHEAVCASGQVASGATLLCVARPEATGFGAAAVPTVNVAVSASQYAAYEDDLDVDGSQLVAGGVNAQEAGQRLLRQWLAYASGQETQSEYFGTGESKFMPWSVGVFA